ncbi:hypothetical protein IMSHALPRED_003621 [Imshaugia aleurites]|uniref:FAD-binding PCMH-type domain-containing protein n=1 Tax=Imshaugia aleurites TaxID=172621 RepID=A0A8H3PIQ8_9LECA|nr:hypothetical protein IMSHALPRED_003621 [Imshaugia aleurites]
MRSTPATASLPNSQQIERFIASLPLEQVKRQALVKLLSSQIDTRILQPEAEIGQHVLDEETIRADLACKISQAVFVADQQYTDFPTDREYYTERTQIHWSKLCWLKPACIVAPKNAVEVSIALRIVTFLQARFAIRSGGHTFNPGWASVGANGILIDLHKMRRLDLSDDGKILSVGPGTHWNDAYDFLDSRGLTVVGGRQGTIGVGGLILGGGLSYLSSKEGLACDNVQNFEVMLADSTLVSANARENPDLFFALKGGGSNFGIVTRFDLYTKPYSEIYFEIVQYDPSETVNLLKALVDVQHDPNVGSIFTVSPEATIVGFVYLKPILRPEIFSSFYCVPSVATLIPATLGTHGQIVNAVDSLLDPSLKAKHDAVAASTDVDVDLYTEMYYHGRDKSNALKKETGAGLLLVYQQISKEAVTKGQEMGHNALGMAAQTQSWFTATATWQDDAHDEAMHKAIDSMGDEIAQMAASKGLSRPQLFPNDATYSQNPMESFGSENLEKMRAVSLKYDRDQVFQKLQNDGFKLWSR